MSAAVTTRDAFNGYIAFVFLYPLLPSVPQQVGLPAFPYHGLLFMAFAFWWTAVKLRNDARLHTGNLALPIGAFLLYAIVSCLVTLLRTEIFSTRIFLFKLLQYLDPSTTWSWRNALSPAGALINWLGGICFLVITIDTLRTHEHVRRLVRALLASAALVSVLGILQYAFRFRPLPFWVAENPNLLRINATWDDPNALGTYLAAMLVLASAMWLLGDGSMHRLFLGAVLPIAAALLVTASRAAIGAASLAIVFLAVRRIPAVEKSSRRILTWVGSWVLFTSVGLIVLVAVVGWVDDRNLKPGTLGELLLITFNPNLKLDVILKGRLFLWQTALDIFRQNPVLGCGIGNFQNAMLQYETLHPDLAPVVENAHNQFLQILAEMGLAGALLFLLLLCMILAPAIKLLFRADDRTTLSWTSGFLLGILAIVATAITGHPLLLPKGQVLFWGMMGTLRVVTRRTSPTTHNAISPRMVRVAAAASVVLTLLFGAEAVSILRNRRVLPYERGFHDWEREPSGRPFRWTMDDAESLLKLEGDVLRMSLRQINPATGHRALHAEVELDGRLVDVIAFRDSNWKELTYYLPDWESRRRVLVSVRACEVFVPSLVGMGNDMRTLGVMIGSIRSECCLVTAAGATDASDVGGQPARWLGYQASFPLDRHSNTLLVPILLESAQRRQRLEFYWNADCIQRVSVEGEGWHNYRLMLPNRGAVRGVLTIRRRPVPCNELPATGPDGESRLCVGDFSWEDLWH